jgi:hypothetical protein
MVLSWRCRCSSIDFGIWQGRPSHGPAIHSGRYRADILARGDYSPITARVVGATGAGQRWQAATQRFFRTATRQTGGSPPLCSASSSGWASRGTASDAENLSSSSAAASPWVEKEVQWWRGHRDAETLLIVVTDSKIAWDARLVATDRSCTAHCVKLTFGPSDAT